MTNEAEVNTPAIALTSVAEKRLLFERKIETTGSTYTVRFSAHSERGME